MEIKLKKKTFTPEQAFSKAMSWCAYQERCHKEVKSKLYEWGLHKKEVEEIISRLIVDGFLNEERFAIAFAGGKFRIKHWGKLKITNELEFRNISPYCIRKAMLEIPDDEYRNTIKKYISDKQNEIQESDNYKKRYKIASYIISKGFEPELIWEILNSGK